MDRHLCSSNTSACLHSLLCYCTGKNVTMQQGLGFELKTKASDTKASGFMAKNFGLVCGKTCYKLREMTVTYLSRWPEFSNKSSDSLYHFLSHLPFFRQRTHVRVEVFNFFIQSTCIIPTIIHCVCVIISNTVLQFDSSMLEMSRWCIQQYYVTVTSVCKMQPDTTQK